MKYLVTGSDGFIGTNLVNFLREKGEEVIGIDYPQADLCISVPRIQADVVVHLAAEVDVRKSITFPETTVNRSIQSLFSALKIAKSNKAKLIFTSSIAAAHCQSPYGASKLACEAICEAYRNSYGMNISVLRLTNVYGPHSIHKGSVIARFIKNLLNNRPVQIYGDGSQTRDFIYVNDVCRAIYNCNGDLTVSTGKHTSIQDIVRMLEIENIEYLPAIQGEVKYIDSLSEVDYEYGIEKGLLQTLNWFRWYYKRDN